MTWSFLLKNILVIEEIRGKFRLLCLIVDPCLVSTKEYVVGYCWNCVDEPFLLAGAKPMCRSSLAFMIDWIDMFVGYAFLVPPTLDCEK